MFKARFADWSFRSGRFHGLAEILPIMVGLLSDMCDQYLLAWVVVRRIYLQPGKLDVCDATDCRLDFE